MTLLTAIQAIVFLFAGLHFEPKWAIGGWLFMAVALLQVTVSCLRLAKSSRVNGATALAGAASLVAVAIVAGLHIQVAAHIITTFTPIGAATGWAVLGGLAAALPWLIALPIWQTWVSLKETKKKVKLTGLVLIGLIAPTFTCLLDRGESFESVELQEIASELWEAASSGRSISATAISTNAELIITVARRGESLPGDTTIQEGDALVIEAITRERRAHNHPLLPHNGTVLSPGQDGVRLADGTSISPRSLLSSVKRLRAGAAAWLPAVLNNEFEAPVEYVISTEGWVVSDSSSTSLYRGWSTGEMSPYDAALAGARQLSHNSRPNGKFSYIIKGPSGLSKGGYNFPRHAGSTWFLAAMANRSGDETLLANAASAVGFMKSNTILTPDGRAYILDPTRDDGKAWVGTTALGLLAFIEAGLEPELQEQYTAFLSSAVMADGEVRGDMDIASGLWPDQPSVTYAFGQVMLALSEAERAGVDGASEALNRLVTYIDKDYWPSPAVNMMILDEHWMCLATASIYKNRGLTTGEEICRAWLFSQEPLLATNPVAPPAGFIGARSEAWSAYYSFTNSDREFTREQIEAHSQLFLSSLYRTSDAPFLGESDSLIGGFRDTPWKLDVQMDAVQHIGFALLGAMDLQ